MKKIHIIIFLLLGGLIFLKNSGQAQTPMFVDKKIADDRAPFDKLGEKGRVSIDGNWAVAGSPYHSELADQGGSVYLYEYIPSACQWVQRDEIFPEIAEGVADPDTSDGFGVSVSIHGNLIAVGAHGDINNGIDGLGAVVGSGIVYIYEIVGTNAVFKQRIFAINDLNLEDQQAGDAFGTSVHLSATHLIVGDQTDAQFADGTPFGSNKGAAFVYKWTGTSFVFQDKIISNAPMTDDRFGISVCVNGDFAAVGAFQGGPGAVGIGKVEIFRWDVGAGEWLHESTFNGVIDAPGDDWDWFGVCLELSADKLVVGAPQDYYDEVGMDSLKWAGSAFIYQFTGGIWSFQQKIVASDRMAGRRFGFDVAISDGNRIIVGSPGFGVGSAYIFEEIGGVWTETDIISSVPIDGIGGDLFGDGVDISGDEVIVSAPHEAHDEAYGGAAVTEAGSLYFFTFDTIADMPNLFAENPACTPGAEVTISVVGGELHDASYWEWYEGDCDSEPIGTGDAIIVPVDGPTTICARGVGQCDWFEKGDCQCITLDVDEGYWHKQTVSGIRDKGNDIITDAAGNVYMAGEYLTNTTFLGGDYANVTAVSGEYDGKSYVAKYDNCGNLLWVAYSNNVMAGSDDFATSVALDQLNGHLYVGGNFYQAINFNSGVGTFGAGPSPSAGLTSGSLNYKGYVARFDMDNGNLDFIDLVDLNTNTEVSTLTTNESTGDLFVGGQAGPSATEDRMYVRRHYPSVSGLGSPIWQINGFDYNSENLMDMDYDEGSESLWLIGDYKTNFTLLGGPVLSTSTRDAFVARINNAFVPSLGGLKGGNITGSMWGKGISVNNETGFAYLTGSYNGGTTNVFGTLQALPIIYSTGIRAYFTALKADMTPVWTAPRGAAAFTGEVQGVDVAFNEDGYVCFVGHYNRNNLVFSVGSTLPYSGVIGNRPHLFVVAYNAATGAFVWNNATTDPFANTAVHTPTSITSDRFGNSFVGGGFRGEMGYMSGTPASGNLNTGISIQMASFTMRVQSSLGGAMQMPGSGTVEEDDVISHFESVSSSNEFEITTYPNPVTDLVNVRVAGFDMNENGHLTVLNLDGKVVMDQQINAGQTDLDFSNLDAGVYFIQVVNGSKTAVQRVIKS